ncbi:centriolin-like isoform X2 [Entelurus aequoreus]|nr:centriolin-like isoform X2 [Entelurus aequoreus]
MSRELDGLDDGQGRLDDGRLDDALSRIAMETQEIKELEKQLTEGQLLANEVLQRDLEGLLGGLQDYLRELTAEASGVRRRLEDTQRHCRRLEDSSCSHARNMAAQREELAALRTEARVLREQQVAMEAELLRLSEELTQQTRTGTESPQPTPYLDQDQAAGPQAQVDREHEAQVAQCQNRIDQLEAQSSRDRNHIAQLEAKSSRDRNHIAQLEAKSSRDRNHIDQLEAQSSRDRNHIAQLEAKSSRDRNHIDQLEAQSSRDRNHIDQQEAQSGRDPKQEDQRESTCARKDRHTRPERKPTTHLDRTGTRSSAAADWRRGWRTGSDVGRTSRGEEPTWLLPPARCPLGGAGTLQEKKKLQHTHRLRRSVSLLCEEVECVEKTLNKRRAELREADRRLLTAHTQLHKAASAVHQSHTSDNSAPFLHLRLTRLQQQQLRSVEAELRDREAESRELCTTIHMAEDRLAVLVSDCQDARACLDWTLTQVEQKRAELQSTLSQLEAVQNEQQRLTDWVKQGALTTYSAMSAVEEEEERLFILQSQVHKHQEELKGAKWRQMARKLPKKDGELDREGEELSAVRNTMRSQQKVSRKH